MPQPMPLEGYSEDQLRDLELMQLVARRDPNAQRELAQRLVGRVRRLSRLLLRETVEAEDAAQLALLEILQSASSFRVAGNLEAWADRITARTTLRLARALAARRTLFQRWIDLDLLEHLPSLQVKARSGSSLDTFLARLSHSRREAFVLKYALGYSVEEIAELTGAPVGTVKDRISSAKKQLRDMLVREAQRDALLAGGE